MVEFEGPSVRETHSKAVYCMRIPNRHFPHLEDLSPPTSPSPLRSFHFQIPSAYSRQWQTPRIDHARGLEISCLFCMLAYAFHGHPHTKQLCIFQLLADSIPCFSGLGASWTRALSKKCYHLLVLRPQNRSFCECPSQLNVPRS
jgi:hypothetical protein